MAQYIWESGVQMAREVYGWEKSGGTVGGGGESCYFLTTASYYVFGVALYENFADEFCFSEWSFGEVVGRVEGFGEGDMLFCYYSTRYAL